MADSTLKLAQDELYKIENEFKKYVEKAIIEELSVIDVAGRENLDDLLKRLDEVILVIEPEKKEYEKLYLKGSDLYNMVEKALYY